MEYYKILVLLAEVASRHGNNTYSITDFALGFIPFKNGENKSREVGTGFFRIARWLLDEADKNI